MKTELLKELEELEDMVASLVLSHIKPKREQKRIIENEEFERLQFLFNSSVWPVAATTDTWFDLIDEVKGNVLCVECNENIIDRIREDNSISFISDRLYNTVIINDVLDHLGDNKMVKYLKDLILSCHKEAVIYCRFHPYTSRSSGHINKAFANIIFSKKELEKMSIDSKQHGNYSEKYYNSAVEAAGLSVIKKEFEINPVEDLFKLNRLITLRLSNHFKGKIPYHEMSKTSIVYKLKIK